MRDLLVTFRAPVSTSDDNCVYYNTFIDNAGYVVKSMANGIYFSDKYPVDETDNCYGSVNPD